MAMNEEMALRLERNAADALRWRALVRAVAQRPRPTPMGGHYPFRPEGLAHDIERLWTDGNSAVLSLVDAVEQELVMAGAVAEVEATVGQD